MTARPLALLVLLASPSSSLAQTPGTAEVTLLQLEVRHLCGNLAPQQLDVIAGVVSTLTIPQGCPGAGGTERILVECAPGAPCTGVLRVDGYDGTASLTEHGGSLVVEAPAAPEGPLAHTVIALLGRQRANANWAGAKALTVAASAGGAASSALVEPGFPTQLVLHAASGLLGVTASFDWKPSGQVRLRATTTDGRVVDRVVSIGERVTAPCAAAASRCAPLSLLVRLPAPRPSAR